MRVVYVADDGTEFTDELECEHYEWCLNHINVNRIKLYDCDGNELQDIMSQDTYEEADVVIVPDAEALTELHELASFTGFCCYHLIDSPGRWVFDNCQYIKE